MSFSFLDESTVVFGDGSSAFFDSGFVVIFICLWKSVVEVSLLTQKPKQYCKAFREIELETYLKVRGV